MYVLVLAICAIADLPWRKQLIRHNIAVLLSELAAYAYRDLWPLATYTKRPLDHEEGWLIWAKIGILIFAAMLIPMLIPNVYTPIDPQVRRKSNLTYIWRLLPPA